MKDHWYKLSHSKFVLKTSDNVLRFYVEPIEGDIKVYKENKDGSVTHFNVDCGLRIAHDLPINNMTIDASNGECILMLNSNGIFEIRNRKILLICK